MVTHLEPDILECEVKWALGSITTNKASGGYGIPAELFPILKDGAVKVLHLICQQIWKTQQWPQDWNRSVSIPVSKKGNAKECSAQLYSSLWLLDHSKLWKILKETGVPDQLTCPLHWQEDSYPLHHQEGPLTVVLICILLMLSDIEHLFKCLFAILISSLKKYLFKSFVHF